MKEATEKSIFYLHKIQKNENSSIVISGCLEIEENKEGQEGKIQRDAGKLFRYVDGDIILIVAMASWVHTYNKAHQMVCFRYVQFNVYQLFHNEAVIRE